MPKLVSLFINCPFVSVESMDQLKNELHCASFQAPPQRWGAIVSALFCKDVGAIEHLHGFGSLSRFNGFADLYPSELEQ